MCIHELIEMSTSILAQIVSAARLKRKYNEAISSTLAYASVSASSQSDRLISV